MLWRLRPHPVEPIRMSLRALLLAVLVSGPVISEPVTFVTPDGMAQAVFPWAESDT